LIFAWAFELTPEGIKLEKQVVREESITPATGRKLDFIIIALLVLGSSYLVYDKFVLDPNRDAAKISAAVQDAYEQSAVANERQDSAKTIAVLPFVNMSDDPNNDYFSDGVSEEILNLLARVPELRVTSRSSAFSFKGQNLDVPTMAAKLNVAHVLEGSVRKYGNQLRITAQLIEVVTDTHLWSETYDRELENVFVIQDEIAASVVDALKITLLGKAPKIGATNAEAYALYLQARQMQEHGTAEANKQAETLLKQSLEIDPDYAPARIELGLVYMAQSGAYGTRPSKEAYELAREEIKKGLAIDPLYGRAYSTLAWLEMIHDWDFAAASQHVQRALELSPGDAEILMRAATLSNILGHLDEAIDLRQRSIALDPISPGGHAALGSMYYSAHRLEEAANSFQMSLSLAPNGHSIQLSITLLLLAQGDAPAALVTIERETNDFFRLFGTILVQHALGDAAASDAALQELIDKYAAVAAAWVGMAYAYRGEINSSFEWLDRAYGNRDDLLPFIKNFPLSENLHDDPRWELLLDKIGLPH
jgi:TolB-like protein